jgi:inhibitor of cysteine peptidase
MGMQRFEVPTKAIRATVGETFAIALEGNPTTGYTWQAAIDPEYLELVGETFEPVGEGVGSGGQEVLRFRALAPGNSEIECEYRRPWDKKARESKQFRIEIA